MTRPRDMTTLAPALLQAATRLHPARRRLGRRLGLRARHDARDVRIFPRLWGRSQGLLAKPLGAPFSLLLLVLLTGLLPLSLRSNHRVSPRRQGPRGVLPHREQIANLRVRSPVCEPKQAHVRPRGRKVTGLDGRAPIVRGSEGGVWLPGRPRPSPLGQTV
jgi:hypothetical protein